MKLRYLFLSAVVFLAASAQAQSSLPHTELTPVFNALNSEDWVTAYRTANALRERYAADSENVDYQLLNYISVFTGAGGVVDTGITYAELSRHMQSMVGKRLRMAGHPTTADTVYSGSAFNTTILYGPTRAFCASTNHAGSRVLCFEYYSFPAPISVEEFDGKTTRLSGVLEAFEINPNHSAVWTVRLHLRDATINEFVPSH